VSSTAQIVVRPELTHAQSLIGERVSVLLLHGHKQSCSNHHSTVSTDQTDARVIEKTETKKKGCFRPLNMLRMLPDRLACHMPALD